MDCREHIHGSVLCPCHDIFVKVAVQAHSFANARMGDLEKDGGEACAAEQTLLCGDPLQQ